jgi:small subunit ribosomal protein S6
MRNSGGTELRLYEAMFVVDSNRSRQDHAKVVEELTAVIQKGGGEVVNCDKWEERRLAYPLQRHKRGTYYLSHFRSDGTVIDRIERAAQLSETVLRVLITVDEDGESFPVYADHADDDGGPGRRGGGRGRGGFSSRPSRGPRESRFAGGTGKKADQASGGEGSAAPRDAAD